MAKTISNRFITMAYLRKYPTTRSSRTAKWHYINPLVNIETEHGYWRKNAQGYCHHGDSEMWHIRFKEAIEYIKNLGPEKKAKLHLSAFENDITVGK